MKKHAYAKVFDKYLQVAAGDIGHGFGADTRNNTQKLARNTQKIRAPDICVRMRMSLYKRHTHIRIRIHKLT